MDAAPGNQLSSETLMQIVQGKLMIGITPTQAREELVRRYSMKIYWYLRRLQLPHPDAEDAQQEVLLRAFVQYVHTFQSADPPAKVDRWLYGIARRQAATVHRLRRKALATTRSLEQMEENGEQLFAEEARFWRLEEEDFLRLLDKAGLTPAERRLAILDHRTDYDAAKVARRLGISRKQLFDRRRRMRTKVRRVRLPNETA